MHQIQCVMESKLQRQGRYAMYGVIAMMVLGLSLMTYKLKTYYDQTNVVLIEATG